MNFPTKSMQVFGSNFKIKILILAIKIINFTPRVSDCKAMLHSRDFQLSI